MTLTAVWFSAVHSDLHLLIPSALEGQSWLTALALAPFSGSPVAGSPTDSVWVLWVPLHPTPAPCGWTFHFGKRSAGRERISDLTYAFFWTNRSKLTFICSPSASKVKVLFVVFNPSLLNCRISFRFLENEPFLAWSVAGFPVCRLATQTFPVPGSHVLSPVAGRPLAELLSRVPALACGGPVLGRPWLSL